MATLDVLVCSIFVNRPVRTRMQGGVGAGGERPPATRLGNLSRSLRDVPELLVARESRLLLNLHGLLCNNPHFFWMEVIPCLGQDGVVGLL